MRALPRIFVPDPIAAGEAVPLDERRGHYLRNVLRCGDGAAVLLFNGVDGEWRARLLAQRRRLAVVPETVVRPQMAEPGPALLFAPLRRENTELVVQKATELGVARLIPVTTERTTGPAPNLARLSAIAAEAAEQSERLTLPVIEAPAGLRELLGTWDTGRRIAACIERAAGGGMVAAEALLVGPEGGFSPAELDVLRACPFISAVSLGPRILRAETAAIAGLALLAAAS